MTELVKLYCTQDEDTGEWLVWFPHPLGGMNVIGTFADAEEAHRFWADQMDSADLSGE
jgi:hypothetical protein